MRDLTKLAPPPDRGGRDLSKLAPPPDMGTGAEGPVRQTATGFGETDRPAEASPVSWGFNNWWEQVNPMQMVHLADQFVHHPTATAAGMVESQWKPLWEKAVENYKGAGAGNKITAARHVLDMVFNVIPGVGNGMDKMIDQYSAGDIAGGTGTGAGVATNLMMPKILEGAVSLIPSPKTAIRNTLHPVRAVGEKIWSQENPDPTLRAAIKQEMDAGVPIPAGTATGNKLVRGIQNLTDNAGGASVASEGRQKLAAAQSQRLGDLVDQANPGQGMPQSAAGQHVINTVGKIADAETQANIAEGWGLVQKAADRGTISTPETAVTEAQRVINETIDKLNEEADVEYGGFNKIRRDPSSQRWVSQDAGGIGENIVKPSGETGPHGEPLDMPAGKSELISMPVAVGEIKYDPIAQETWQKLKAVPPGQMERAYKTYNALKAIMEGPDYVSADIAEFLNGNFKETTRKASGENIRNMDQGSIAYIQSKMQDLIDQGVGDVSPEALKHLHEGRSLVRQKWEIASTLEKFRDEPVQTFNQLVAQGDRFVSFLRDVKKLAPSAIPAIRQALLGRVIESMTKGDGLTQVKSAQSMFSRMGNSAKRELFGDNPALLQETKRYLQKVATPSEIQTAVSQLSKDPLTALSQLTSKQHFNLLQTIKKTSPQSIPIIRRALLQDLLDKATVEGGFSKSGTIASEFERIPKEMQNILFEGNQQHLQQVKNALTVFRKLSEEINPSGSGAAVHHAIVYTSSALAAMGALFTGHPLLAASDVLSTTIYHLGTKKISQLMWTPQGMNLLTKAMKTPMSASTAAKATLAMQILKMANEKEDEPQVKKPFSKRMPWKVVMGLINRNNQSTR